MGFLNEASKLVGIGAQDFDGDRDENPARPPSWTTVGC